MYSAMRIKRGVLAMPMKTAVVGRYDSTLTYKKFKSDVFSCGPSMFLTAE
jgi:hypothetical protein